MLLGLKAPLDKKIKQGQVNQCQTPGVKFEEEKKEGNLKKQEETDKLKKKIRPKVKIMIFGENMVFGENFFLMKT